MSRANKPILWGVSLIVAVVAIGHQPSAISQEKNDDCCAEVQRLKGELAKAHERAANNDNLKRLRGEVRAHKQLLAAAEARKNELQRDLAECQSKRAAREPEPERANVAPPQPAAAEEEPKQRNWAAIVLEPYQRSITAIVSDVRQAPARERKYVLQAFTGLHVRWPVTVGNLLYHEANPYDFAGDSEGQTVYVFLRGEAHKIPGWLRDGMKVYVQGEIGDAAVTNQGIEIALYDCKVEKQ